MRRGTLNQATKGPLRTTPATTHARLGVHGITGITGITATPSRRHVDKVDKPDKLDTATATRSASAPLGFVEFVDLSTGVDSIFRKSLI
jgi:hypothetical protein